ncbi:MAG: hypothetical protein RR869_04430 [Lachnospiraceae bacterium]
MGKRLIIDGTAVYELDEDCMLKKKAEEKNEEGTQKEHGEEHHTKKQR